jgi:hypothetical protein
MPTQPATIHTTFQSAIDAAFVPTDESTKQPTKQAAEQSAIG